MLNPSIFKIIFITEVLVCTLFGCDEKDNDSTQNQLLINEMNGDWTAVEVYSTDGSSQPKWDSLPSDMRFNYLFSTDYKVSTSRFQQDCDNGQYLVSMDSIIDFTFPCISYNNKIDSLTDVMLILDTKNFEPLKYRFRKTQSY